MCETSCAWTWRFVATRDASADPRGYYERSAPAAGSAFGIHPDTMVSWDEFAAHGFERPIMTSSPFLDLRW